MTRANIVGDVSAHRSTSIAGTRGNQVVSGRAIRLGVIVGCGLAWALAAYLVF